MSEKRNLRVETLEAIERSAHQPRDIVFIGSMDQRYTCTWERFGLLADVEYNPTNTSLQEVAFDLVILFKDGEWLERASWNDGEEGWAHRRPFPYPYRENRIKLQIKEVFGLEESLAGINERG